MIKEIKTEKFEGLAVLMPELFVKATAYMGYLIVTIHNEASYIAEDQFFPPDKLQRALDRVRNIPEYKDVPYKLPDGDYKVIGKATELTEEQCAQIVPQMKDTSYPFEIEEYKVTFDNLLQSMECYSVNPYGDERKDVPDLGAFTQMMRQKHREWQEAQANSGTWLILKKP